MVNKYRATCGTCGATVPPSGGRLERRGRRWVVRHLACAESGRPEVVEFRFSSGERMYQNARGRCEDAPCCGCCS
jgi:hypothetical protein